MSFRVAHDWKRGALISGTRLSTCAFCGTLRSESLDGTTYTRHTREADRVVTIQPPCIEDDGGTAGRAVAAAREAERKHDERKRAIAALPPDPPDEPEPAVTERPCFFPWPSNLIGCAR